MCRGIAYRVAGRHVKQAMKYLWDREMPNRTYACRDVTIRVANRRVKAWAFVVRRQHPQYAPHLSLERTAELICQGYGARGPCVAYLENTVEHLDKLGIVDRRMHAILARVKAKAKEAAD